MCSRTTLLVSAIVWWGITPVVTAQTPPAVDRSALAKASQNPVGDLVTLPFQFNFNSGGAFDDRTFFNLNFQPVMPIKVSPKVNLILRTIVPYLSIPAAADERAIGFGDIQEQLYFTSTRPGKIIWGLGPVLSLPTATAELARTGTWAGGIGGVVLTMPGAWVIGALANHFWPISDEGGSPETHQFVLQYFINYNFGAGWALSTAPLITANWDAASGQQWTVPFGVGISKTLVFGQRPMSMAVQFYYNAERPDGAAATQLRYNISLLYPQKKSQP